MARDIEELRQALREGDNDAFRQVVRELTEPLYRYVRPQLQGAAQDVVQQAFIRLWKHRKRLKADGSLRTYLFFIATNLVRDTQRREALRRKRESEAVEMRETEDPGLKALAREAFETARQLPTELREVVLLRFGQGFTAAETAAALGIPEGTVKTRQRTALEKLREKLPGFGVLPAGVSLTDLEESLREGTKTSVKVPTSLVMNVEALVMANVGTNTGVTVVILSVVLVLLMLAGGAALGVSWLTSARSADQAAPLAALPGNEPRPLDSSNGSESAPLESKSNSPASKPSDEAGAGNLDKQDTQDPDEGALDTDSVVEFSARGRVVDDVGNGIGGAWVGVVPGRNGDSAVARFESLGFGSLSQLDVAEMARAKADSAIGWTPDFQFEKQLDWVTTDSRGYFELKGRGPAPQRTAGVALKAWAPGFRGDSSYVHVGKSGADESEQVFTLHPRDRFLTFRVDPPVRAEFQATLSAHIGTVTSSSSGPCEAGPAGRYQIDLDNDHAQLMRFRVPGFAVSEVTVPDHGEKHVDAGEVKLEKGRELSGVVVNHEGKPVAGALVKLHDKFDVVVECDADGSFSIEGVGEAAQELYARNAEYAEAVLEVPAGEGNAEGLRIKMVPGVSVEGMVRFKGLQVPEDMRNVKIVLIRAGKLELLAGSNMYRFSGIRPDDTQGFRFNRVAPGDYILRGSSGGKSSPLVRLRVEDRPVQADVVFGGGISVSGHITGKDGNPVTETDVALTTFADTPIPRNYRCETDGAGDYRFEDVEPGTYVVIVQKLDSAFDESLFSRRRVVVEDTSVTLDIDYSARIPGNRIFGCVTLDGQPLFNEYMIEGTGLNNGLWHVIADETGSFEIQGIPPGAYYVYVSSRKNSSTVHRDVVVFDGWNGEHDVSASLTGGTLTVKLTGEGLEPQRGTLSIRPLDDGRLGPDVLLGMIGGQIELPEDGECRIPHLVTGKYVVVARIPGFGAQSAVVEVSSKSSVELQFTPELGSVAVELQSAEGLELKPETFPYCMLSIVALDMPGQPVMTTQPVPLKLDANLLAVQLAPGRYRLNTFGPLTEPSAVEFEIKTDEEAKMALQLHAGAQLQLTVDLAPELIGSALVTVIDAASGERVLITGRVNPILSGVSQSRPEKRIDVSPLSAGNYRVEVRLRGYKPIILEVTLERGQVVTRSLEPITE